MPKATEVLTIDEAARRSGRKPSTLRVQALRGRLRATKHGRDWLITPADLDAYVRSVEGGRLPEKAAEQRQPARERAAS